MKTWIASPSALKRLSLVVLTVLSGFVGNARAHDKSGYADILNALQSGANVMATVKLQRCVAADGKTPGPDILGGFRVIDFLVPGSRYIAISHTHGSLGRDGKVFTEYMQYRVKPDGMVEAHLSRVDDAGPPEVKTTIYSCTLGDGVTFVW